jgi:hypothetical protein
MQPCCVRERVALTRGGKRADARSVPREESAGAGHMVMGEGGLVVGWWKGHMGSDRTHCTECLLARDAVCGEGSRATIPPGVHRGAGAQG